MYSWFLYTDGAYNTYSSGDAVAVYGVDLCQTLPDLVNDKVSSVRYAGPPVDFQADSLQTYRKSMLNETIPSVTSTPDSQPFYFLEHS